MQEEETKIEEINAGVPGVALAESGPHRAQMDEIVEGPVIAVGKAAVYIDLKPFGTWYYLRT